MNRTQNYQLCLWDAEDKVQRTDFNADNAKIDAALKSQADGLKAEQAARAAVAHELEDRFALHTIKSVVYSGSGRFEMDVSDVNWAAWRQAMLLVDLKMTGPYVEIAAAEPLNSYTIATCNKSVKFPFLMFPFFWNDTPVAGLALGNNSAVGVLTQLTYKTIATFHMSHHYEASILAGTSMTLYGIK